MTLDDAASLLAQLGNRARLEILRLLVKAGPSGLAVGEIQEALGLAPSTLAFHLRGLVSVGIVTQEREGRTVLCRPCFAVLDAVTVFLKAECCTGAAEARQTERGAANRPGTDSGTDSRTDPRTGPRIGADAA
jgi:DNA-binding transcriptional ArsR family regulator